MIYLYTKFQENQFKSFCVILLTGYRRHWSRTALAEVMIVFLFLLSLCPQLVCTGITLFQPQSQDKPSLSACPLNGLRYAVCKVPTLFKTNGVMAIAAWCQYLDWGCDDLVILFFSVITGHR